MQLFFTIWQWDVLYDLNKENNQNETFSNRLKLTTNNVNVFTEMLGPNNEYIDALIIGRPGHVEDEKCSSQVPWLQS